MDIFNQMSDVCAAQEGLGSAIRKFIAKKRSLSEAEARMNAYRNHVKTDPAALKIYLHKYLPKFEAIRDKIRKEIKAEMKNHSDQKVWSYIDLSSYETSPAIFDIAWIDYQRCENGEYKIIKDEIHPFFHQLQAKYNPEVKKIHPDCEVMFAINVGEFEELCIECYIDGIHDEFISSALR